VEVLVVKSYHGFLLEGLSKDTNYPSHGDCRGSHSSPIGSSCKCISSD